ncbi:hypothetical protein PR048_015566 [Dryococelus australis]|uniref:Uncharacterized protein n=1 Tax=Dryococelus australis TaxID=614101 RepID=A0ABQ9HHA7_9NEOP|nr:hypothetical protein PR048_015566 [Dryococelus australis]
MISGNEDVMADFRIKEVAEKNGMPRNTLSDKRENSSWDKNRKQVFPLLGKSYKTVYSYSRKNLAGNFPSKMVTQGENGTRFSEDNSWSISCAADK